MEDIKDMDDGDLLDSLPWFNTKIAALSYDDAEEITAFAKNILEKIGGIFRDEEVAEKYLNNGEGDNKISQEEFIKLVILKYKQQTGKKGVSIKDLCDNIQRKIDVHNFEIVKKGRKPFDVWDILKNNVVGPKIEKYLQPKELEGGKYKKTRTKPKKTRTKPKNNKRRTRKKSR
jgi:hypothetical protein